jgi:hypothetical protein
MAVAEALRAVTGGRFDLSFELLTELEHDGSPAPQHSEEEWVRRFMEEFDAEEITGEWGEQGAAGARAEQPVTSSEKGA